MRVQQMINDVYRKIMESKETSTITPLEILSEINYEQKQLGAWMRRFEENYFIKTVNISKDITQDGNEEQFYDLPIDVVDVVNVRLVENGRTVTRLRKIPAYTLNDEGFYFENNKLVLTFYHSTQQIHSFDTIEVRYKPSLFDLTFGRPIDIASNQIQIVVESSEFDDVYIGYQIDLFDEIVLDGTGSGGYSSSGIPASLTPGERFTIIDYDGENRIVTLDRNKNISISNITQYSLISPIPEEHHELIVLGALIRIGEYDNDMDVTIWKEEYLRKTEMFKMDAEDRTENLVKRVNITCPEDYIF